VELVDLVVVADFDPAVTDDARGSAVADGAGVDEPLVVAGVVGFRRVRRAIDHVIAVVRRPVPGVGGGVRVMLFRGVQEGLRGQAADVRAASAEPAPVDHGD
jgi:hypothetical protein